MRGDDETNDEFNIFHFFSHVLQLIGEEFIDHSNLSEATAIAAQHRIKAELKEFVHHANADHLESRYFENLCATAATAGRLTVG